MALVGSEEVADCFDPLCEAALETPSGTLGSGGGGGGGGGLL